MSQSDVLGNVVQLLSAAGIPYMFSGSLASSTYGEPRSTQDMDVIIDATRAQLDALVASFGGGDYYVSPEAAAEAFRERSMFNVIHLDTGWKVDLILLKQNPFDAEQFRRRT